MAVPGPGFRVSQRPALNMASLTESPAKQGHGCRLTGTSWADALGDLTLHSLQGNGSVSRNPAFTATSRGTKLRNPRASAARGQRPAVGRLPTDTQSTAVRTGRWPGGFGQTDKAETWEERGLENDVPRHPRPGRGLAGVPEQALAGAAPGACLCLGATPLHGQLPRVGPAPGASGVVRPSPQGLRLGLPPLHVGRGRGTGPALPLAGDTAGGDRMAGGGPVLRCGGRAAAGG